MSCDYLNKIREKTDYGLQIESKILNEKSVTVIKTVNSGANVFGRDKNIEVTSTRLLVGEGYSTTDGYYDPNVKLVSSNDVFLSQGRLTNADIKVGPFVYQYTDCNGNIKGIDISLVEPIETEGENFSLEFEIEGLNFNAKRFKRKYIDHYDDISFVIYLTATGITTNGI